MTTSNEWRRDGRTHMGLGILALAFGALVLVWPSLVFNSAAWMVGLFLLALGVMTLWGMRGIKQDSMERTLRLVLGVGGLAVGALTLFRPSVIGPLMIAAVAIAALVFGGIHVYSALRHPKAPGAWIVGAIGGGMLLFGVIVLSSPLLSAIGARWALGGLAVLLGIGEIALGRTRVSAAKAPSVTFLPEREEEPVKH